MSKSVRVGFCLAGLCIWLLAMLAAVPALAGGDPSPESCAKLGTITVKCRKCDTGDVLGTVVADAGYNANNQDCLADPAGTLDRCVGAAGLDKDQVGMTWTYMIKATQWSNWYPRKCQH